MGTIRFGTDGWRGVIADDFTYENVRICAQGVASYLKDVGLASRGLVVGYDTRFASQDFANEVVRVMSNNDIQVFLCERATPTPVVTFSVLAQRAGGAAIITASHNPSRWNGFKYKPEYAGSASPEIVAALEERIVEASEDRAATNCSREYPPRGLVRIFDPMSPYLEHVRGLVDVENLKTSKLRVKIDAMYGAGSGYLPALLSGGQIEFDEMRDEQNPSFPGLIQPEPIAQNLKLLAETVVAGGYDVGLALDGDADRLGVIDEKGNFITPLEIFALLALYLLEIRGERGPLIKSVTMTRMIYKLGELYGIPVIETPVGFKYIGPKMIAETALAGGEESGGYGFRGHIPERDGIVSALYFLDLMAKTGKNVSELVHYLFSMVGSHYYKRWDIMFPQEDRTALQQRLDAISPGVLAGVLVANQDSLDGFRCLMEDGSWVAIRFSGTEPLVRVYAESCQPEQVERLIQDAANLIGLG